MSVKETTIALPHVVTSVLDADNHVTATSAVSVLNDRAVLIGTNKGSVLFCTLMNGNADVLEPHSDTTLHCGAIYNITVGSHHLVATAGHDAVSCVFPLHALYRDGGVKQCRRITGHTVPVVAVRFLADGTSLVTLGSDGRILVVDVRTGAALASLSCGFAATCLACSVDETYLFVGGRSLASIDLYHALRPVSLQSVAASAVGSDTWASVSGAAAALDNITVHTPPWLRLYEWEEKCEAAAGKPRQQFRTPPRVLIRSLAVDASDGALTAVFARNTPGAASVEACGSARWAVAGGRTASKTTWAPQALPCVSLALRSQLLRDRRMGVTADKFRVRCRVKSSARPSVKPSSAQAGPFLFTAAAPWSGRWYTSAFELAEGTPQLAASDEPAGVSVPAAEKIDRDAFPPVGPRTSGEELLIAQAQCDALQRECDALVSKIKSLLAHKAPVRSS
ncbi:hypothetical protein JKF63_05369 [Porcisia hertigi]|uniref:Uncharacterized protein n=1 Tax=Porcisia hertigi TaxID=2761500 RepID=A0A836LE41_9TRYP|nr:hypothetical protein JKF63_05369 [Porcisia hertigi]